MGFLLEFFNKYTYGGNFIPIIIFGLITFGGDLWSEQWVSQRQATVQIYTNTKLKTRPNEESLFKVNTEAWKQGSDLVVNIHIRGRFASTGQAGMDMNMEIDDAQSDTSANPGEQNSSLYNSVDIPRQPERATKLDRAGLVAFL